jgi:hypothetical protein
VISTSSERAIAMKKLRSTAYLTVRAAEAGGAFTGTGSKPPGWKG